MDDGWEPIDGPRRGRRRRDAGGAAAASGAGPPPRGRRASRSSVRARSRRRGRRHPAPPGPPHDHARRRPRVGRGGLRAGRAARGRPRLHRRGLLYAQTLSRLVGLGFKVIAIDTAGHGGTLGLPTGGRAWRATPSCSVGCSTTSASSARSRRPLDGRPPRHRAGRQRARPGHRRDAARRHRRRHLGPHGQRLPLLPAAAGRDRRHARGSTPSPPSRGSATPGRPSSSAGSWAPTSPGTSAARGGCSGRRCRSCAAAAADGCSTGSARRVPVFVIHGDRDFAVPLHGEGRRPPGPGRPGRRPRRHPLLAAQGPGDAAGDHARPDAGPAGHGGPEGQARPRRRSSMPPTRRWRRRSTSRAPWCWSSRPGSAIHDTEELHRPPRYSWTVHPARSKGD